MIKTAEARTLGAQIEALIHEGQAKIQAQRTAAAALHVDPACEPYCRAAVSQNLWFGVGADKGIPRV